MVTCIHAAKYLPTVRSAVPWYIWPLLAVASAVKAMPVDFGVDEVLFALIAWRRPDLLRALYREAQAGNRRRADALVTPDAAGGTAAGRAVDSTVWAFSYDCHRSRGMGDRRYSPPGRTTPTRSRPELRAQASRLRRLSEPR